MSYNTLDLEQKHTVPGHMVDTWSEVCGSVQLDWWDGVVVGPQDPLHTRTVGVARVEVLYTDAQ